MHLKSIMLKGFKSFPDRTTLEFGSGVSVIVGPNGSGKSNITDAVLWALGEQSPLAVRGQTMQDVIFAGGDGARSRNQCDVEVVIDNSDGTLSSEFSEISISRHIDRSGEGVYRLNGARCRLVDVMEVLSDSGLGKEMHSVISQGRVEQIIHSKPADRTVLIEEAAGLSKHRKRRRRAQLKLERTQDNLNRALDVEREARMHLRPLKRQAEAAELHARVERQSLELREQLTQDALLVVRRELAEAEQSAGAARRSRDELSSEQSEVGRRREQTERGLADHGKAREQLAARLFATSSAAERIAIRLESIKGAQETLDARLERSRRAVQAIAGGGDVAAGSSTLEQLEAELRSLDHDPADARLATELQEIERERLQATTRAAGLGEQIDAKEDELERAERAADEARDAGRRAGEQAAEAARKRAALELELASIVERQQLVAGSGRPSLAQKVTAEPGFEAALAAALGGRLTAILAEDLGSGTRVIERSSPEGARVLVKGARPARAATQPPVAGAVRLLEHLSIEPDARELVERLLGDAWVVDRIEEVGDGFEGVAVTRAGIAYHGRAGELRRLPAGGPERVLAERSRRGEKEAELALVSADLERGTAEANQAAQAFEAAEVSRDDLRAALRELRREREEALEAARRAVWLSEQRRDLGSGPVDTRRAQLMGEIAAERRLAENLSRERSEREKRRLRLEASVERDQKLLPLARRLEEAMQRALEGTLERRATLEQELSADEEVGERAAAELRRLAQSEYDLQARLRDAGELLTQEEVKVAQIRDRETTTSAELAEISQKLGEDASAPADQPLTLEERAEVEARLERLERRRERIGPVNPLAEGEYQDALEHVEDLERQRNDLEAALAELETLIRETDRRIRESFQETFEVTARNFEEVIQHLFPGGRGRLRLVKPPQPRVVLGGTEEPEPVDGQAPPASEASDDPEAAIVAGGRADEEPRDTPGVEIEVTPAGKSTKRLSLLSGGEKSLVALGFLFAVFLARPCPFYILDEVEAALDDRNIDRFLRLVMGYADRSQFIIITHQRRTMEAADVLYGVSMGGDGISKVVSRRLESESADSADALTEAA